jgi:hypothetical protein
MSEREDADSSEAKAQASTISAEDDDSTKDLFLELESFILERRNTKRKSANIIFVDDDSEKDSQELAATPRKKLTRIKSSSITFNTPVDSKARNEFIATGKSKAGTGTPANSVQINSGKKKQAPSPNKLVPEQAVEEEATRSSRDVQKSLQIAATNLTQAARLESSGKKHSAVAAKNSKNKSLDPLSAEKEEAAGATTKKLGKKKAKVKQ